MPKKDKRSLDPIRVELESSCIGQEYTFFTNEANLPVRTLHLILREEYGATAIRYLRICARPARLQSSPRFSLTVKEGEAPKNADNELWQIFEIRALIGPLDPAVADDYIDVPIDESKAKPAPKNRTLVVAHFERYWHDDAHDWEIGGGRVWIGEDESGDSIVRHFRARNWVGKDGQYHSTAILTPKSTLKDLGINPNRKAKNIPNE